ncbi:DUF4957 domain-containing protein [Pedobacter sp. P351]|uniref:DUF4957 domain-containing protein n=1 Tax=Pedobacter superstes TaxID=3133441 RepID=UPI0030A018D2
MKKNIHNIIIAAAFLIFFSVVAACTKSFDGYVEDPTTNRAFVPRDFRVRTAQDTAVFTWNLGTLASGRRYTYKVEISGDSTFQTVEYAQLTDTLGIKVLDPTLAVNKKYYARLRVEPYFGSEASRWVNSPSSFRLGGQQYLKLIRDFEVNSTSVILHWYTNSSTSGIDKVLLTKENDPQFISVPVSASEAQAGEKVISGLTPGTKYSIQLMAGTKSKGLAALATPTAPTYTSTLTNGADLAAAITSAANGDVIGLEPGTYVLSSIFNLSSKRITLRSTSNNPLNTKVKIRELNLVGDSAAVTLLGLDVDGNYSGTSKGGTFIQLKGTGGDGNAATFGNIRLENCHVHNFTRAIIRGNYGTAANSHIIPAINISNCLIYDVNPSGSDTYYMFSLEKLQVLNINISKSTFYNLGDGLINMSTTLTGTAIPAITIDQSTFNNIGSQGKYLLYDVTNNRVVANIKNSIFANSPLSGQSINGTAFRSTNTNSTLAFTNNNYFKLNSSSTSTSKLVLTGLSQSGNYEIDLGWTAVTNSFSLGNLPPDSPLLKASSSGNTIGDPRWAY